MDNHKPKNTTRENTITLVITTILNFLIFGAGFWGGKQYNRMTNKLDLQGQRIKIDSMTSEVKIWKLQMIEKYKNCQ